MGHSASHVTTRTPEYLHAAVRHGHGVVGQRVTGYLAVIGTGGWRKDVARPYVVWIDRLAPLEGPAGTQGQQCIAGSRQEPRWPGGPRTAECSIPQSAQSRPAARGQERVRAESRGHQRGLWSQHLAPGRQRAALLCPQRRVSHTEDPRGSPGDPAKF